MRSQIRHWLGTWVALVSFLAAAVLLAIVQWGLWKDGSAAAGEDLRRHRLGLAAALVVSCGWFLFAALVHALTGVPSGRKVGAGWALLNLSGVPFVWEYRQGNLGEVAPGLRGFELGLGFAGVVLFACLLPRVFRLGLGMGLVFCLVVSTALGAVVAFLSDRFSLPLGFLGIESPSAGEVMIRSLELGLLAGAGLGLLLGLGACAGWVQLHGEEENANHDPPRNGIEP